MLCVCEFVKKIKKLLASVWFFDFSWFFFNIETNIKVRVARNLPEGNSACLYIFFFFHSFDLIIALAI